MLFWLAMVKHNMTISPRNGVSPFDQDAVVMLDASTENSVKC